MKRCTKCGESKPLSEFYKNRNMRDGLQYWCKDCEKAYRVARAERLKARTEISVPESKRCGRCGETRPASEFYKRAVAEDGLQTYCKACHKAYQREYTKSPRGRAVAARYSRTAGGKAVVTRYQQTQRGKAAAARVNAKRRVALENTECTLTAAEWLELVGQHTCCLMCRREFGPALLVTQDHIVPLSRGGTHTIGNVQPLCRPCNSSKGNTL